MERKMYLNRGGMGQEKPSYVKILLWAAIGLVGLMIIVPLFTAKKGAKNGLSKSGADKGGAMVREIPKSAGGISESGQQPVPLLAESKESGELKVAPLPGMQPLPESQAKVPTTGFEKPADAIPGTREGSTSKTVPVAKDQPAPVTSTESEASQAFRALDGGLPPQGKKAPVSAAKVGTQPAPGQLAAKPKDGAPTPAAPKSPAEATKPKPAGGELYAVQVGSYHDKKHAEELQQNLKKKGYAVSVRTKPDPKGGQLYVVQLDPVTDMGKAHTLVAQIQNEEKVKPFVTKVQPGEEAAAR